MVKSVFNYIITICLITGFVSCNKASENKSSAKTDTTLVNKKSDTPTSIKKIENAHNKQSFNKHKYIKFHINVLFNGKERLNADMFWATNSSQGVIIYKNGKKIYVNNNGIYHIPDSSDKAKIRFDAYTWAYFFLLPYKLDDQGTQWSVQKKEELNGKYYNTQKLTFETGTGETSDDWYIIYSDSSNNLINTAAYIVTAGKTLKKAEEEPHAIKYENYKMISGVPISTNWTYWIWNPSKGLTKQLGEAILTDIEFVTPNKDFFVPSNEYIKL